MNKAYFKERYIKNKTEMLLKSKEYYQQHKAEIAEKNKVFRANNVEKIKLTKKAYRIKNADSIREKKKELIHCELCNVDITKPHYNRHKKTFKHISACKDL